MSRNQPEKQILDRFSGAERDEVLRLWGMARRRGPSPDSLKKADVEVEWMRLREHLASARESDRPTLRIRPLRPRGSSVGTYAFIMSMAALLLGGFIFWYLFVPVSVQAPRGEYVSYEWGDGVRIEMNSGSEITWNRNFGNGHHKMKLSGEAYFEVPSTGKPFHVQTPTAHIEVLGTRFNVRSWPDDPDGRTTLTLIDGQVTLAPLLQPENKVMIPPGHISQVDKYHATPQEPEPVDTEQALAWRKHGFYFSAVPMSEVAAELERRYDLEITFGNEGLKERALTIYLPNPAEPENIIESLCFVTGCRFDRSGDTIVIF